MKKEQQAIVLKERWEVAAHDAPSARSLEMVEIVENNYMHNPFPISLAGQKRLLELIYSRQSGIITRQELIDVIFNPEDTAAGTIFKRVF